MIKNDRIYISIISIEKIINIFNKKSDIEVLVINRRQLLTDVLPMTYIRALN